VWLTDVLYELEEVKLIPRRLSVELALGHISAHAQRWKYYDEAEGFLTRFLDGRASTHEEAWGFKERVERECRELTGAAARTPSQAQAMYQAALIPTLGCAARSYEGFLWSLAQGRAEEAGGRAGGVAAAVRTAIKQEFRTAALEAMAVMVRRL
jgi:hypothetical protein